MHIFANGFLQNVDHLYDEKAVKNVLHTLLEKGSQAPSTKFALIWAYRAHMAHI